MTSSDKSLTQAVQAERAPRAKGRLLQGGGGWGGCQRGSCHCPVRHGPGPIGRPGLAPGAAPAPRHLPREEPPGAGRPEHRRGAPTRDCAGGHQPPSATLATGRGSAADPLPRGRFGCGLGSYYGTIGGSYAYFSPQLKAKERYIPPGKNFYTNPGKKGSGYGYANLTIGEQYPHEPDGYEVGRINAKKAQEEHKRLAKGGPFKLNLYPKEYFDMNPYFNDKPLPPVKKSSPEKPIVPPFKPSSPAKKSGGMKGGTFDPYPSHSADPYIIKKSQAVTTNKEQQIFHPPAGPKSRPVRSIITLNVTRSLNVKNYKTAQLTSY